MPLLKYIKWLKGRIGINTVTGQLFIFRGDTSFRGDTLRYRIQYLNSLFGDWLPAYNVHILKG